MVMAGLLWYDDDGRRPLTAKIIEAAERYRERIGFEPTVCQLPPQQWTALTAAVAHPKRSRTPVVQLPRSLRLESDEHLSANYFLLGMGENDLVIPNPLLAPDDPPVGARRGGHARAPRVRQSDQPPRPAQRTPAAKSAAIAVARVEANPLGQTPKPRKGHTSTTSVTPQTQELAISAPQPTRARAARAPKMPAPPAPVTDMNALKPKVRATKPSAKIAANAKPSRQKPTGKTASASVAAVPLPVRAKKTVQSSAEKPIGRPATSKAKATKLIPSTPHKAHKAHVAQVSLWDFPAATVNTRKRSSRVDASTPAAGSHRRAVAASKQPETRRTSAPRGTHAKATHLVDTKTAQPAATTANKVRDTLRTSARVSVALENALPGKLAKTPKKSQREEPAAPSSVTKTSAPRSARKAPVAPKAAKPASSRSRGATKPVATKARASVANHKPTSVPKAAATPATRKSPASGPAQATPPPPTTTRRGLAKSA